jgi:hypothetical protein
MKCARSVSPFDEQSASAEFLLTVIMIQVSAPVRLTVFVLCYIRHHSYCLGCRSCFGRVGLAQT